jgi:hypothetical protein
LAVRRPSSAAAAFGNEPSDVEYPTVSDATPEVIDTCSIPAVKGVSGCAFAPGGGRGEPVCKAVPVAVG